MPGRTHRPIGLGLTHVAAVGMEFSATTIHVTLESIGLTGQFTWDITPLSELQMLDLSYNKGLTGTLTPAIGNLTKLTSLILEGCNFYGPIPPTIGYLQQLTFLSLNSNGFSGKIPPSIGNLSNLFWLDLTNNSLSGNIPVSSGTTLGLDRLVNTQHFHFGNNQLSGPIPPSLFHSGMKLIHVLFDSNQLTGTIPSTLGLVQTLIVVRLDWNLLTGTVPSNFSRLVNLNWLYLSNNQLTGPVPNLSGLNSLSYMDLSNNAFDSSLFPSWLSNLQYLTTILMENTNLVGPVPPALFSLPELQRVYAGLLGIASLLSQVSSHLPSNYGFVYFSTGTYVYYAGGSSGTKSSNTGVIIGAAVGGSVLLLLALLLGFYALRQKRRAENTEVNDPFAAWDPNTATGAAPLIQGAKYFSFDELKKYTNDFAEANSVGSGGYGKVYRGTLPDGQLVAIKRAKQASAQGGLEFKMEIELLSRGYMDPEYYMTQQVTEKSDVYSFGVVLLELVTARQPIDKGKYIVREVREGMDRDQVLYGLDKILDPAILDPTPKGLENFVDLAMKCLEEEGARRPSMGAVVKEIENIMQIAGLNPNADSASSSATHEVDDTKGHIHPYTDDSLFVYSGAFPLSSN
ncbi:hypothetical protein Vadar_006393 [Vaccinium darrowii]|uniref:Uncharacterized protein n=1 Tax=Vaccinium darrowii TaxID=229202 RepID=A0ACB7WY61_9ERIC|nr:hypothetical protein Vadar_006393 [Vaccinium darrowii]